MIDAIKRSARRNAKKLIAVGKYEEIPYKISVGYTD